MDGLLKIPEAPCAIICIALPLFNNQCFGAILAKLRQLGSKTQSCTTATNNNEVKVLIHEREEDFLMIDEAWLDAALCTYKNQYQKKSLTVFGLLNPTLMILKQTLFHSKTHNDYF